MPPSLCVRWRWIDETALLGTVAAAELERAVDASLALGRELRETLSAETAELVPGAGSLLVLFADLEAAARAGAAVAAREEVRLPGETARAGGEAILVETSYGGSDGPDLAPVAERLGLAESELVRRHSAPRYRVAFLGFSPGFPYLVGLPAELRLPRLSTPRPRVAAGSVAIAGPFGGIYPQATPGGWHLLGRTALSLFDLARRPPAALTAGAEVRFVPR